jgi:hypothetical protein
MVKPNSPTDRIVKEIAAKIEKDMRSRFGDKFVDGNKHAMEQRDNFKTELTNAIESGKSGAAMARFLNDKAWLWSYLYENVERDREFQTKIAHALDLCSPRVPEDWHRAVRVAKEHHPTVMELRRRFP